MEEVLIVAIVLYFIYRVIETLVHRKERIVVAEKVEKLDSEKTGKLDTSRLFGNLPLNRYSALRWGCLIVGAAFGLLLGLIIDEVLEFDLMDDDVVYFASTFLFGGLGLLISFALERIFTAKDRKEAEDEQKNLQK